MSAIRRSLKSFGHFWWDFLVGDTPELFFATLAIVATALSLRHDRSAAVATLPVLAIVMLTASTYRGRKRRKRSSPRP